MHDPSSGARSVIPHDSLLARSTPATRIMQAVAVLGILFGCAGMISMPFGLIRLHSGSFAGDIRVRLFTRPVERPSIDALWMYAASLMGAGLSAMLLVGSVAALNWRAIARPILFLWSIGSLVVGFVGCFFYLRWLFSPAREEFGQVRGVVDSLVNFGGWGIGTPLAIAVLVLLTRPAVREAFLVEERRGATATHH